MTCDFSLNHFRETLERALEEDYSFLTISKYIEIGEHPERLILLRHDVDYSIDDMMNLAEIERKLGIKSTVFIRVHSKFYNPFDKDNFERIVKLKEMGHEIGLHFEPVFAKENGFDIKSLLARDSKILEEAFDLRVRGVGTHLEERSHLEISEKLEWIQLEFSKDGRRSIMRYPADSRCLPRVFPDLFEDYVFLRDTNAEWVGKSFCESIPNEPFIYVLIHPTWWNLDNLRSKNEIIKKLGEGW